MTSQMTGTTVSLMDNSTLLRSLNYKKATHLSPVIAYFAILMIFGITGNILVCYVYKYRFRAIPSNYFILCLAALDLISCCVGMPSEIADLLFPLMYNAPAACKLFRFLESVTLIGSGATLISVAFDRYYKLCKPLDAFPLRKAKVLCIIAVSLGIVFAWPALVIFGEKTVRTEVPGLYGCECSIDDAMQDTIFPSLYYGTLLFVFVVCLITITVLYSCMGYKLRKLRKKEIGNSFPKGCSLPPPQMEQSSIELSDAVDGNHTTDFPITTNHNTPRQSLQSDVISGINIRSNRRACRLALTARRTTAIFFAVTLFFILSFLPFLVLMILRALKVAFRDDMSVSVEVGFNFGVRSYFLNNTSNPIIYGVLNPQFRKECLLVIRKLCTKLICWRNRSSRSK